MLGHVTLVFRLGNVRLPEFIRHCDRVAERLPAMAVDFCGSEVVHDPFEDAHKLFLSVSAGRTGLIALHERLYDGPQRVELDSAFPYRPHMTVATHGDRATVERLDATEIGAFPFFAKVRALKVVELRDRKLRSLRTIPLLG